MDENQQELIAQFVSITSSSTQDAQQYLESSSWDLNSAVTEFYNPPEETEDPEPSQAEPLPERPSNPTPAAAAAPLPRPIPTTSSMAPSSSSSSQPKKKFATLGDLQGSSSSNAGRGTGPSSSDSEDDDPQRNLFAGGERSGLAVQNPDDLKRKILERARRNAERPGGDEPRAPRSNFGGTAHTLGSDDTPSVTIPDPNAHTPSRPDLVTRNLHFWQDGFSVDEGPLFRFDDPANTEILAQIRQGRAPMNILNVTQDQEVDVHVQQHHNEYYKPPKKKFKPFEGGGHRLGSEVPGETTATASAASVDTSSVPAALATPAAGPGNTGTGAQANANADLDQPTIPLQIRLGDGTRLVIKFNTTQTIGDVYEFVTRSSAQSAGREWVLATTFPTRELTEKEQVLGEIAEFKRGGNVNQKWL